MYVLNRTLHGKGAMSPRCPSTIEFTWSEATTAGRGSAPWSAWTTQQTRTVFGTQSPPWMCGVASLEPQHSEVRELLCQMTHAVTGVFFLSVKSPVYVSFSLRKVQSYRTVVFILFCSVLALHRHDLCCRWLRWQPSSYQHGAIWPKHWPVEHAGRHADS